jgi:ribosomal protein S6--L-glutamate ligase
MKIAVLTRLSHYYSEQRLQEEAVARGHELDILHYPACYISIDADQAVIHYKGERLDSYDAVIPRSFAGSSTYGMAILRQFETLGAYSPIKSLAVTRSIDGLRSMQILMQKGVPIPKTVFLREPDQADELIEHVGLPAVVKIASTVRKGNTVLAETRKAVASVIRAFYVNDATFLLQEYIHGEKSRSVRAIVVGSSVVASVRKSQEAYLNGSDVETADQYDKVAVLSEHQKKVAIKAAKAIGLSVCMVDMIIADEAPVVLGVSSYFGLENIEKITKRNVAGKIIEYIELNAKRRNKKDKIGA